MRFGRVRPPAAIAFHGYAAAVQVHALVAAGADVTVKNVEGETALDMAAKPGFSEVRRNVRQTT